MALCHHLLCPCPACGQPDLEQMLSVMINLCLCFCSVVTEQGCGIGNRWLALLYLGLNCNIGGGGTGQSFQSGYFCC